MITIVVDNRYQLLGNLQIDPFPHVKLSKLGEIILFDEFRKIPDIYPNVEVWDKMVMPDHIHFILNVKEDFQEGKHLSSIVRGFKIGCTHAYNKLFPQSTKSLFERGFNDKILMEPEVLGKWKHYLDDNPRRLALKRQNRNLFTVVNGREIFGNTCQMIGNSFLLDYPDKMCVVVHRRDSELDFQRKREKWLKFGERGGVLVSAAVAPREKQIMREALNMGYNLIHLNENGFGPLYKPPGEFFDACAQGRFLQISPWPYHMDKRVITREQCLYLNDLASKISDGL